MTEEQQDSKKADILRKVRALLDNAADFQRQGNFATAESYQAKADSLMMAYAIEEAELAFARPAGSRELPVFREYEYAGYDSELGQDFYQLFVDLCRLVGVMRVDTGWSKSKLIGYTADLDYLDLMWTSLKIQMISALNPTPDKTASLEMNVILMKECGLKWQQVFDRLQSAGFYTPDQTLTKAIGVWYTKIYTAYCKENNRPRQYASPSVYRRSFIGGYVDQLRNRIYDMRTNRDAAAKGHEMVIAGKEDAMKEMLYDLYPDRRPHPDNCECDSCHFVKCVDETCTRPRCVSYRRDKNKPVRAYKAPADPIIDAGVRRMGRAAADKADLSGGRNKVGNPDRSLR